MTITGVRGIDVSHWNGDPNWPAAAAAGIAYAGTKVADGTSGRDRSGPIDLPAILAHMLAAFPYLYLQPMDAVAQAGNLLAAVANICAAAGIPLVLGLPVGAGIMLDAEQAGLTAYTVESVAAELYRQTKLWPAVYVNPSFASSALHDDPGLSRDPLWLADWTPPANVPAPWRRWWWWQTGIGTVPGVAGPVDVDTFAGDTIDLQRFIRKPTLTINAHHPAVGYLQRTLLRSTTYDVGPVDSWYGPRTAAAVGALQAALGLVVDRVVGSVQTWPVVDYLAARDQG